MDKKLWIILTDDWELKGNGLGSVYDMQYKPALKLMDLYQNLNVPAVFNVEVMQQLAFEKYSHCNEEIKKESFYWKKTIQEMYDRGFDIQLHIHPQWHNAIYDEGYWRLDSRWNIGDYQEEEIQLFIAKSISYLKEIIPKWQPKAFRGGSWGIMPNTEKLFEALLKHGIGLDVSLCQGIVYNGEAIRLDYTNMESPYLPYYPDWSNPLKKTMQDKNMIEIPTQSVKFSDFHSFDFYLNRVLSKFNTLNKKRKTKNNTQNNSITYPSHVIQDPFGFKSGQAKEEFIIDFSNAHTFRGFKVAIDILINRALIILDSADSFDFIPLIFENHTKNLDKEKFKKIEKIILYIKSRYGEVVEFKTLTDVAKFADKMYVNVK